MGSFLLLFTLMGVYIIVYWLMAAEKNPKGKYFGILGFLPLEKEDSTISSGKKGRKSFNAPQKNTKQHNTKRQWHPKS
jgi:hypothetical protein